MTSESLQSSDGQICSNKFYADNIVIFSFYKIHNSSIGNLNNTPISLLTDGLDLTFFEATPEES